MTKTQQFGKNAILRLHKKCEKKYASAAKITNTHMHRLKKNWHNFVHLIPTLQQKQEIKL